MASLVLLESFASAEGMSQEALDHFKERYAELSKTVAGCAYREADALNKANDFKRQIRDDNIAIETARIRKAELLDATDAAEEDRKQAATALTELESQLSNVQTEINEAILRENELTEDVAQLQRANAATIVPALSALAKSISDLKEEASMAESHTQSMEENRAELRKRMEKLTNDIHALEASAKILHTEELKAAVEPARLEKQIESVDRGLGAVDAEVHRLSTAVNARVKDLDDQKNAVSDVSEVRRQLEKKLSRHRSDIETRDQEVISLERTLRMEKGQHRTLLERRVEVHGDEDRAKVSLRAAQGELGTANQAYERAKRELKSKIQTLASAVDSEAPVHSEIVQKELDKKRMIEDSKRVEGQCNALKREMDTLVQQYVKEESVEKKHRSALQEVAEACAALETERDHWHDEEVLAHKQIAALKLQREMKAREVEKTVAARRGMIETSRMRELNLSDLSKQLADVNGRLKQFASLYDVVKSEKNSYAQAIQSSHQSAAEMRERLKILKNEVDILNNESGAKDKAVSKEVHSLHVAASQRDSLRNTVNKSTNEYSERQLTVQQQILSIDKLSSVIDGLERDMSSLTKQYEAGVELRNFTGIQLMERNDELVVLNEKSNVHEKTITQGEAQLHAMGDELRGLSMALQELDRTLHVARLKLPETSKWAERILELQNALVAARQLTYKLSAQLEGPSSAAGSNDRWSALPGDDPDMDQLEHRVAEMEGRLDLARQDLLERELVVEELKGLCEKITAELHGVGGDTASTAAAAMAKLSNELQSKIRDSTRKLMALVSEISMYQATAIKLGSEITSAEEAVAAGEKNLAAGLPPSLAAEQRWSQLERQSAALKSLDGVGVGGNNNNTNTSFTDGYDGAKTTADVRPNGYIPEGVGIPKPYSGFFPPFKPSEPGASIRHYKNPEAKPIDM